MLQTVSEGLKRGIFLILRFVWLAYGETIASLGVRYQPHYYTAFDFGPHSSIMP